MWIPIYGIVSGEGIPYDRLVDVEVVLLLDGLAYTDECGFSCLGEVTPLRGGGYGLMGEGDLEM